MVKSRHPDCVRRSDKRRWSGALAEPREEAQREEAQSLFELWLQVCYEGRDHALRPSASSG